MASPLKVAAAIAVVVAVICLSPGGGGGGGRIVGVMAEAGTWCVVRSDASEQLLQLALDYACSTGADCAPIQSSGLCYLPNTLQAHASYAFNSYFQRRSNAPGSCDFAGAATIARTDPSYGSCVYPSSASMAGGAGVGTGTTNPSLTAPPPPVTTTPTFGRTPGLTPGFGPQGPDASDSKGHVEFSVATVLIHVCCLHLLLLSIM
ncbi:PLASMODESMATA CALLOSE-BINDING PROTEIN 3-like [Diospyros lotus]|uniref:PLASMODESMATA CALLOSE-BINDING PROTEIN 3-like n=1 Tax=Diospyros lotus TaxID=55363 RepID=UPI0022532168|nr:PLASMODESMATA CALLOSE-BINDING PROTEIN 3-like [Diospyros lotus]